MNITYFLGAGASANSLPLNKEMGKRMNLFNSLLRQWCEEENAPHRSLLIRHLESFDRLLKEINESLSFDAYVKTIINRRNELKVAKCFLNAYLIFEQSEKQNFKISDHLGTDFQNFDDKINLRVDPRYRSFFNTVLDKETKTLSSNIKILSWNYDLQLEISYAKDNLPNINIETAQSKLRIYPSDFEPSNPQVLKLNGTAGLFMDNDRDITTIPPIINNYDDIKEYIITNIIANLSSNYSNPILSFAWEKNDIVKRSRNYAKKIIENTEVLVVIGYSFPDLNREIDKTLFKDLFKLQQIYYQTLGSIDVIDSVHSGMLSNTKPEKNVYEFFVPPEFYQ